MIANALYALFFLVTFPIALNRDRLFGAYYAALYLYSAVAIYGYMFIPGPSERLGAYFGEEVGYAALFYCFATLALFFFLNLFLYGRRASVRPLWSVSYRQHIQPAGVWFLSSFFIAFVFLGVINFAQMNWFLYEAQGNLSPTLTIFLLLFKMCPGIFVTCYALVRLRFTRGSFLFITLTTLLAIAFVTFSIRLGNRTDLAATTIGVLVFEISRRRISVRTMLYGLVTFVVMSVAMSAIAHYRDPLGVGAASLNDRIVLNDYFAPAHMLFTVIAFDYVRPMELVLSNSANALILLKHPYLQQSIMELIRPGLASRTSTYAFYVITEGWMAIGPAGFVYSAVLLSGALYFWNKLARTNDEVMSAIMRSILACMVLNLARGQTSYFVKYLYTFALPVMIFLALSVSLKMSLFRRTVAPSGGLTRAVAGRFDILGSSTVDES